VDSHKQLKLLLIHSLENVLVFDFQEICLLDSFAITELFVLALTSYPNIKKFEIRNPNSVSDYLNSVGFFKQLAAIYNFTYKPEADPKALHNKGIAILTAHEEKSTFYAQAENIYSILLSSGLSNDTASIITASFLEVIDNAFIHNLGKWPTNYYKKVVTLIHHHEFKKEIAISVADLGIGFLGTLKERYPDLTNETESIALALKANTSSRPKNFANQYSGGNGLFYLQKNIFNGLKGELYIRSTNTLLQITSLENFQILNSELPYKYGANIFFKLKYV